MVPFKYFFWSALFGGMIGGICVVMLTFKIYVNGNEEPEEPAEDPNEEELEQAIQEEMILVREPVEHDERTERSYGKCMSGKFCFLFSLFAFLNR